MTTISTRLSLCLNPPVPFRSGSHSVPHTCNIVARTWAKESPRNRKEVKKNPFGLELTTARYSNMSRARGDYQSAHRMSEAHDENSHSSSRDARFRESRHRRPSRLCASRVSLARGRYAPSSFQAPYQPRRPGFSRTCSKAALPGFI